MTRRTLGCPADVGDLRDWVIVRQTYSRREGGGYLRDRIIFSGK